MRRFRELSLLKWVVMVLGACFALYATWCGPFGIKVYRLKDGLPAVAPMGK
jgi:hypothetical protein